MNATNILLQIDISGVTHSFLGETSSSLSVNKDMIETTSKLSKDSSGNPFKEFIGGEMGYTFSVSGIYDPTLSVNFSQMLGYLKQGTSLKFIFGGEETGDKIYSGNALISSLSFNASKNETPTLDAELQGTGELTEATL